jgi:putative transposase
VIQNCLQFSRRAPEGRPGDLNAARTHRSERLYLFIATSFARVLRGPIESAQYACGDYTELLRRYDIAASMSRVGNPYDNAKAESFMKTLKQEEVNGQTYRDAEHAKNAIGAFIEEIYNRQRLHSALAYRPPAEFEANLPRCGAAAQQSRSAAAIS